MSVLDEVEYKRSIKSFEDVKNLAKRFDVAVRGGDQSTLQWLKEALPTFDNIQQSSLLNGREISDGLKKAGYKPTDVKLMPDNMKKDVYIKSVIGNIIEALDNGNYVYFCHAALINIDKALEKLNPPQRADGKSWAGSIQKQDKPRG